MVMMMSRDLVGQVVKGGNVAVWWLLTLLATC